MMTNVYDIGVRYMRKVQVKEYEPCEAEVSIKAQIAEGEDYVALGNKLMGEARTMVLDGIANKASSKARTAGGIAVTETKVEEKSETKSSDKPVETKRRGRPTKAEQEAKKAAEQSEFPDDDEPASAKEEADDEFGEEDSGVISATDLRNLFTATIRKNVGITPPIIKGWLSEYNAAGVSDLSEDERDAVHKKLLAALAKIEK